MAIKLMPEKNTSDIQSSTQFEAVKSSFDRIGSRLSKKANSWLVWVVVILTVIVLTYLGMLGYKITLGREIKGFELGIGNLEGQRDLELEQNFINLSAGIEVLKKILSDRIYPSQLFIMLEELTLPDVRFIGMEADLEQATLKLNTEALNYSTLAKQVYVFNEDERVDEATLSEVKLEITGRVSSDVTLTLEPSFFSSSK